jgi:serine/threonine protein kinase
MISGRSAHEASFGPYEIRASLGRGGGGEVYRAWDPRLEREVALKILHKRFERDPERVRSFVAEARAASALNHPNIIAVFDAAVDGGTPYIVSELVDGRPLRDELQRGPLALRRLLDLAAQIADGLSAAHDAGIRHGDLKPENIMVTRAGRVKILDFGLARARAPQSAHDSSHPAGLETQTEVGLLAGTVPYMSPEQARGMPAGFHADQFSFGLILYEMVMGRRAFDRGAPAATLDAIMNDEAPPLPATDERIPVPLRWIIERCLAKDPGDRYGATSDLYRDLRMLRDRLGETVSNETAVPAAGGWGRYVSLAASGALLFVAGAVLMEVSREPTPPDLSGLVFTPLVAEPGYQGMPAWSPNGQTIAYVADVDSTLQIFTRSISSSESAQVTHQAFDCTHPFWSPDGQRIYYVSLARDKQGIWSVGATGGTPQLVVENATRGAISPDNQTLAFLRDEARADVIGTAALWLSTPGGSTPWPAEAVEASAKRRGTFSGLQFIEGDLAFSPDGRWLGVYVVPGLEAEAGWQFWVVPLPDGDESRRLESVTRAVPRISAFTWLADSRHVVLGITTLGTPGSHLWMADLDTDRAWQLTHSPDSQSYPSAVSTGGRIAFTAGEPDYDIVEISLDQGVVRPLLAETRNESDPVLSPNGRQMAYVTDRRGQDEIWVRTRQDQIVDLPRVTQSDFVDDETLLLSAPSFSPDGRRIAYQRNGFNPRRPLKTWISMTAGGQPTLLSRASETIQGAPTWSPDGQWIAYSEWQDNEWHLVKVRVGLGTQPVVLRRDGVANATPHWSPTGEWITWETEEGFLLVSADEAEGRRIDDSWSDDPWLVHTWTHDGSAILGIKETLDRRLVLVRVPLEAGPSRVVADLGPAPPVNNPVKGLSADNRAAVTSIARAHGDIWALDGLDLTPRSFWRWR